MTYANPSQYDTQIARWLLLCAAVVLGMIMLGGATRLTNSGLSMVEWKPLIGIIPPLSEQAWLETFAKYVQAVGGEVVTIDHEHVLQERITHDRSTGKYIINRLPVGGQQGAQPR